MRKAIFLFSILALLMGAMVISAQDDDTPVDPATFEGNWCDEGGKWYDPVEYAPFTNRCDAQPDAWSVAFMWVNGWYGALYDAGGITLEELGELDFTILGNIITGKHPEFLIEPKAPVASGPTCYVANLSLGKRIIGWQPPRALSFQLIGNTLYQYENNTCSGNSYETPVVRAASQGLADTACQTLLDDENAMAMESRWETTPALPSNLYECGAI
jgi:hypothetical protein